MASKRLPKVLERDEAERLLAAPNTGCPTGLRNRVILEVMYRAGLRVSEVVKLRPSHVRWASGTMEIKDGKGGKERNVPIDQETLGWLRAWQTKRKTLPRSRYFFCTLKGGQLSTRYIQAMVKRVADRARIEQNVTPHVLRHTYATELLDEGFTLREVQDLLGHASVQTTQIYTHVRPGSVAEKIRRRIGNGETRRKAEALAEKLAGLEPHELKMAADVLAALLEE